VSKIIGSPPIRFRMVLEGEVAGVPESQVPAWLASKITVPIDLIQTLRVQIGTQNTAPPDPKILTPN
jgi:hypothetical protein